MRTTVELPTDLLRSAKARASTRGESLRALFTRAVQVELSRGALSGKERTERVALPLFGDPAGPEVRMSGADVARFLAADEIPPATRAKRSAKR